MFKNMKKTFIIIIFYLFAIYSFAQTDWITIKDYSANIEFSMPEAPIFTDTLSTIMYSSAVDSTEALQVHIYKGVNFDSADPLFNAALTQENGDTLRAVAKLILFSTNSEFISMDEEFNDGKRVVILGIKYWNVIGGTPNTSYIKYFIENNNFVAFTWTGTQTSIKKVPRQGAPPAPTDPTYKDVFFDSLKIY